MIALFLLVCVVFAGVAYALYRRERRLRRALAEAQAAVIAERIQRFEAQTEARLLRQLRAPDYRAAAGLDARRRWSPRGAHGIGDREPLSTGQRALLRDSAKLAATGSPIAVMLGIMGAYAATRRRKRKPKSKPKPSLALVVDIEAEREPKKSDTLRKDGDGDRT